MTQMKPLSIAQMLVLRAAAGRPDQCVLPLPPNFRARGASKQKMLQTLLKAGLVEEVAVGDASLCWRQDASGQRHTLRLTSAGLAAALDEAEPNIAATAHDAQGGQLDTPASSNTGGRTPSTVVLGARSERGPDQAHGSAEAMPARTPPTVAGTLPAELPAAITVGLRGKAAQNTSEDSPGPMVGAASGAPPTPTTDQRISAAASRPTGKLGSVLDAVAVERGASLTELVALTGWLPHTARAALTGLRRHGFPVQLVDCDGRKAYRLVADS